MRRCFVISPIGAEGSAVREHSDDVFDYIIKPAMEECGVAAYRSDHMTQPGKITDQMFSEILNADLCIAVLTGLNPNVLYEIAVAQCAGRPVVMLAEKGLDMPFDVADQRCVYYDLKPRNLFNRVHARELSAHVRFLEAGGFRAPSLLQTYGGGAERGDAAKLYGQAVDFGGHPAWLHTLEETHGTFDLMSVAFKLWRDCRNFPDVLRAKIDAGCQVRILLMDPQNPQLEHLVNSGISGQSIERVRRNIDDMSRFFEDAIRGLPSAQLRYMKKGGQHFQLVLTDRVALLNQYLFSETSRHSPLWTIPSALPLYKTLQQEFHALWELNAPRRDVLTPSPAPAARA
jgi:hypothetical protein